MNQGKIITDDISIKKILEDAKSIAILGLSPKSQRDSNKVGKYMKEHGYKIIPIRPGQKQILGEKAFASLDDIQEPVDIVNVFRRSEQIMPHAEEALRNKPNIFWMQLGIENQEAARMLTEAGIDVIMDMCIKVEHNRLCK